MAADATSIQALAEAAAEPIQDAPIAEATETTATEPAAEEITPEGGPEAAEVPPESPPDEQGGDDAGAAEEPDDQDILVYMKETHSGLDYTKYKDDVAFLKGAAEAMQVVGRRDEDAQLGKQVRGVLGDQPDQLESLLKGEAPLAPEPPANGKPDSGQQDGPPDFNQAWLTHNDKGELVPALGAPKDVAAKYQAYQSWRERRLDEMAVDPGKFFGEAMTERDKAMEGRLREAREVEAAQERQEAAVGALCEKHSSLLHVDGDPAKGLSVEGERVKELFDESKDDFTNDLARLRSAIREVQHDQPKPPPRRPRGKAVRQAGVASVEPEKKTVVELLTSGLSADGSAMGLAEAMEKGVA